MWELRGADDVSVDGVLTVGVLAVILHVLTGSVVGDVLGRAPVGSRTNAILVCAVAFTAGFWSAVVNAMPFAQWLPFAVPILATPLALCIQVGVRASWRLLREYRVARRVAARGSRRALVVGAGGPARQLVRSMLSDPDAKYLPVGFLAHDPARRGHRPCGLPVLGTETEIVVTLSATGASVVVLAAPALEPQVVESVARTALATGVEVKTLPSAAELDRHTASVDDLRDVAALGPAHRPTS